MLEKVMFKIGYVLGSIQVRFEGLKKKETKEVLDSEEFVKDYIPDTKMTKMSEKEREMMITDINYIIERSESLEETKEKIKEFRKTVKSLMKNEQIYRFEKIMMLNKIYEIQNDFIEHDEEMDYIVDLFIKHYF